MLSGVGSFTSACGITVYLGGAFPPSLGLFSLVAEPAQNLVHRDILTPSGATYIARRAHEGVEFLASTDAWFRPVNFSIGPDGAIYMVDYYRQVVEHPEWMATHTHQSPDLYQRRRPGPHLPDFAGDTAAASRQRSGSAQASDGELVQRLGESEHLVAPHRPASARRSWQRGRRGTAHDVVREQPVRGRAPARALDARRTRQARDESDRESARRPGSRRARKRDPARRAASVGQSRADREAAENGARSRPARAVPASVHVGRHQLARLA